ncbi:MAG TPA: superoxide dismutase [Afifellaceae bacterium]|nr:superoxide dismutase [Afifellaceae bacterium]
MSFTLPDLPYAYDALAPHMSAETLEFHHDKHHNAYLVAMNDMIAGTDYAVMSIEDIVKKSFKDDPKLFNQAAQYYNHIHFWKWMSPDGGGSVPGAVESKINEDLGSMDQFRAAFIDAGKTQFGSGWAWLALKNGKLEVMKTPNGENPLVHDAVPLLGVDVWEHSYYIDYRNARPVYLETWFDSLVNWDYVAELLEAAG